MGRIVNINKWIAAHRRITNLELMRMLLELYSKYGNKEFYESAKQCGQKSVELKAIMQQYE